MCYCDNFGSFDAIGNSINLIWMREPYERSIKVKTYLEKAKNGTVFLTTKCVESVKTADYENLKLKIDEHTAFDDKIINYCPFCGRKLKESE